MRSSSTYERVNSLNGEVKVIHGGGHGWLVTSTTPVDVSGNSLATESENEQETFYAALDQTLFGANRSAPTSVNEPDEYAASFINSEEGEVVPGISAALLSMGINQGEIPAGTVITVTFSDGTTAQYVKQSPESTYQWVWNGVAHNKNGQLINRNGTVISNANTSGSGGGSAGGNGFGSGSSWLFELIGGDVCTTDTTVTINGVVVGYWAGVVPC